MINVVNGALKPGDRIREIPDPGLGGFLTQFMSWC